MSDVIIPLCTGAECTFETLELDGNDGMDWNCPDRKFWSEGVKLAVRQIFVDLSIGKRVCVTVQYENEYVLQYAGAR